jgi:Tfp pilus assembly protein PilF
MPRISSPTISTNLFSIAILVILVSIVYSNSFNASWHYDDYHHIVENTSILKTSNIPLFFTDPGTFSREPEARMYRPLLMTSYALNYRISGHNVAGYHVVNFVLHMMNVFLLYIVVKTVSLKYLSVDHLDATKVAVIAAIIQGIHPLNTQTVTYISSRSSLMATCFYLGAFILFLTYFIGERKTFHIIASCLLFFLALLSKEIAATLPAVAFLFTQFFQMDTYGGKKHATNRFLHGLKKTIPLWTILAGYLVLRHIIMGENLVRRIFVDGGNLSIGSYISHMATQIRAWVLYLREFLFPVGLSIDKSFKTSHYILEPGVIFSALIILCFLILAWKKRKQFPVEAFFVSWFFITLLPTSAIRLNAVVNDHRMYLPGIALCTMASILLFRMSRNQRNPVARQTVPLVLLGILLTLGVSTYGRNQVFSTEETLWKDVLIKDPSSYRASNGLAIHYDNLGQYEKAVYYYNKAIDSNPNDPTPYANLALLYANMGRTPEAVALTEKAISLGQGVDKDKLWNNLGLFKQDLGDLDGASEAYKRAIGINPGYYKALANLAEINHIHGNYHAAIELYSSAISINPGFSSAYYGKASALDRLELYDQALLEYRKFIKINRDVGDITRRIAFGRISQISSIIEK